MWDECEDLLDEFCAEAGLPTTAVAFTEGLRSRLTAKAAEVDAGYPTNADLVIDAVTGEPDKPWEVTQPSPVGLTPA